MMKRTRFTEGQIIGILREHEVDAATADVCRRHGVSGAAFYKWKAKYGSLDVSEAKRRRTLEEENRRLKKLLAETMLDNAMLKGHREKNGDARCPARGCGAPVRRARGEPAAGVPCDRG